MSTALRLASLFHCRHKETRDKRKMQKEIDQEGARKNALLQIRIPDSGIKRFKLLTKGLAGYQSIQPGLQKERHCLHLPLAMRWFQV